MKNIVLVAALIGASSSAFAETGSFGKLHGYTTPFQKNEVVANKGQYADAGQFGRISGYGNAINQEFNVNKGVYANVGEFGRLSGYGKSKAAVGNTAIAAR